ncbi:MAG: glycosyltransferase family 1 protein, partial [Planctomycetota bacterium]
RTPALPIEIERINVSASDAVSFPMLPGSIKRLIRYTKMRRRTSQLNGRTSDRPGFDLFHLVDGSLAFITERLPGDQVIVTCHDVIPWLQMQGRFDVPPPGVAARYIIRRSLRRLQRCGRVLCDSENTRRDLSQFGMDWEHAQTLPLAIEPCFFQPRKPRRETQHKRILHIGNNGFYKNRCGAIRVFHQLVSRHWNHESLPHLAMVGPPPSAGLRSQVADLGLEDQVEFMSDVDDSQLLEMYAGYDLLLFPSFYEGFGWPPLEAMASGCPVVASDRGSLPEVTGPSPAFAPEDVTGMARCAAKILECRETASRLETDGRQFAEQFSLQQLGNSLATVYREQYRGLSQTLRR